MILNPDNEVVEKLTAAIDADRERRVDQMPTEQDALWVMHRAYQRLCELGWNDAIYCPKDGTPFEIIEAGSTGIFEAHYEGEWPTGSWWAVDGGDLWPSRPTLFRLKRTAGEDVGAAKVPRDGEAQRPHSNLQSAERDRDALKAERDAAVEALYQARDLICADYSDDEVAALEGHPIHSRPRPAWDAICAAIANAEGSAPQPTGGDHGE